MYSLDAEILFLKKLAIHNSFSGPKLQQENRYYFTWVASYNIMDYYYIMPGYPVVCSVEEAQARIGTGDSVYTFRLPKGAFIDPDGCLAGLGSGFGKIKVYRYI